MIEMKNLNKSFGELHVLKNISLQINQGEVVAIIGPSGSGKSTLLRCINLMEIPTSGQVLYKGKDITDKKVDINLIRQSIGMVFQQFNLFPHKTILENLTIAPMKVKGLSKEDANERALKLLKRVGLENKAADYPSKLSGGQQQRIAIARALCMEPDFMLFDEPTSALDPEMVKEVLEVIQGLVAEGMTIIIVTHEMGFAKNIASRIVFMDDGTIIEDETPEKLFHNPNHQRTKDFLDKIMY